MVVELAGPQGGLRPFVQGIVAPINYPNMSVQLVEPAKTERYRLAFSRLADLQSSI